MEGGGARALLSAKVGRHGPLVLYDGCLGAAAATWVGHYPWFTTYNFLNSRLQVPRSTFRKVQLHYYAVPSRWRIKKQACCHTLA